MLPKGRDRAPGDAQATAVPFRRLVFVPAVRQDAHTPAPHAGLVLLNPEQQVRGAMLITSKLICIKMVFRLILRHFTADGARCCGARRRRRRRASCSAPRRSRARRSSQSLLGSTTSRGAAGRGLRASALTLLDLLLHVQSKLEHVHDKACPPPHAVRTTGCRPGQSGQHMLHE